MNNIEVSDLLILFKGGTWWDGTEILGRMGVSPILGEVEQDSKGSNRRFKGIRGNTKANSKPSFQIIHLNTDHKHRHSQ